MCELYKTELKYVDRGGRRIVSSMECPNTLVSVEICLPSFFLQNDKFRQFPIMVSIWSGKLILNFYEFCSINGWKILEDIFDHGHNAVSSLITKIVNIRSDLYWTKMKKYNLWQNQSTKSIYCNSERNNTTWNIHRCFIYRVRLYTYEIIDGFCDRTAHHCEQANSF